MKSLSFDKIIYQLWANTSTIRLLKAETKLCKNPKACAKSKQCCELRLDKFTRLSNIASRSLCCVMLVIFLSLIPVENYKKNPQLIQCSVSLVR